jgi:DNA-binding transcriptional LysR family regulator
MQDQPTSSAPLPHTRWMRGLRLRQVQLLQELARQPSLTAAAAGLNMTQPAVSQQLADIEGALGVTLFERGKGLRPTAYGEAALRWAAQTVASARQLDEELAAMRSGASGLVRVGVMLVAANELVPRVVGRLAQDDTMPRLVLHEDIMQGLWTRICGGELDLIVGRLDERVRASPLPHEALYEDKHCVAVRPGHPLAGRKRPTWAEALHYAWVLPPENTALRRALTATFLASGLPAPVPRVESNSLTVTQAILRSSDCVGVMSGSAGRHAQADGLLRTLPLELAGQELPVGAVWRESTPSPAVARVLDLLRSEAREVPAAGRL